MFYRLMTHNTSAPCNCTYKKKDEFLESALTRLVKRSPFLNTFLQFGDSETFEKIFVCVVSGVLCYYSFNPPDDSSALMSWQSQRDVSVVREPDLCEQLFWKDPLLGHKSLFVSVFELLRHYQLRSFWALRMFLIREWFPFQSPPTPKSSK